MLYRDLVRRHRITAIAAEAASFNPKRFTMAAGLCMSIGALTGVAAAPGLELYELPPKRWQCAILGRGPGSKGKIDYGEVERRLIAFLVGAGGTAAEQLAAIPAGQRNHAQNACGVGVFAALRPEEATRIGATRGRVSLRGVEYARAWATSPQPCRLSKAIRVAKAIRGPGRHVGGR
jgi:hypothetical protein